ncbi:LLM class flavin-dependent oxidoreductase [Plantactinospora sp. ZYX-F-223]|uniref:LLM class flavin-dependent oxidoreductase n=1 Tax=Plantactinospora sp. ZYX-F-223 TaxID=3144103 RepID=UPI0031FD4E01
MLIGLLGPQPTTTFNGRYYRLDGARCDPRPVQQPHPPLCIGGNGEKRTLLTAAKFAQHWNFDIGTLDQFRRTRDVLYQHCSSVGRDPGEIRLSAQVRFTGDAAATAATAATFAAEGADLAIVYLPVPYTAHVLEPLAKELAQVR